MKSGGVTWTGVCAVAWNVERCAMWNEVYSVGRHGRAIRDSGGGVTDARCGKWWDVECHEWWCTDVRCGMLCEHGSGMWNWV